MMSHNDVIATNHMHFVPHVELFKRWGGAVCSFSCGREMLTSGNKRDNMVRTKLVQAACSQPADRRLANCHIPWSHMSRLSILPFQTAASVFTLYYAQCKFIPRDLFQPYSVNAALVHICARWLRTPHSMVAAFWKSLAAQDHYNLRSFGILECTKVQLHAHIMSRARNAILTGLLVAQLSYSVLWFFYS